MDCASSVTDNDDVPHLIVSATGAFKPSPLLDTGQRYGVAITQPGTHDYFCSLHPVMQGKVVVTR